MDNPVAVFWFRRDLRFDDNQGLYIALKSGLPVLPVFVFDTTILNTLDDKKDARVTFIYNRLVELNQQLKSVQSSLCVLYGSPMEAFEKLTRDYAISHVYANHDYEPYAIKRDKEISDFLMSKKIKFSSFKDQVIFEKNEVLKADGKPYTIYTPYSRVWKTNYLQCSKENFPSEDYLDNFIKMNPISFPTLSEIGFEKSSIDVPPLVIDKNLISNYELTRNFPAISGTSRLSVHLRFGTVSVRKLVALAWNINEQWLNELIWREFFMMILYHFPRVVTRSFKPKYDEIVWRNNEAEFEKWCKGETGYPIVDAGMRELNATGFMHNRVRMIVASFLTKHLLIDWRWGEAYFASKLLDYELAANNGNWQWAAGCGCDAAPYFRVFNPTEQTKKFDPELKYILKWVKNFNDFDYPQPIVEHTFARERALSTFKKYLNDKFE